MTPKAWSAVLVVVLAAALIVAGCGDDDDSDGGATTTVSTESGAGNSAVEGCVATAEAVPGLSAEARGKVEDACQKGASGDPVDAFEASAEACQIITEDTVPEGPAREQALAACGAPAESSDSDSP